jgi:hypothetical protein
MIMSEILDACLDSAFEGQQCVCVCVCVTIVRGRCMSAHWPEMEKVSEMMNRYE